MPTGTVGKILTYGDPPVVSNGSVAPPDWAANITASVNQGLFASNARAIVVPAYNASAFASGGTAGGWSDAAILGGYMQALAASNYLVFNLSGAVGYVPIGANGRPWELASVSCRMKTIGAGAASLRILRWNHQSSTTAALPFSASATVTTTGSTDQFFTATTTAAPYVFTIDDLLIAVVTAGNIGDQVYSITVNFNDYGL